MHTNINDIDFLKFDFQNATKEKVAMKCSIEFVAQTPEDESEIKRAVLVKFSTKSADDVLHLNAQLRVIFYFDGNNLMPADEDAFLDEYYLDAYQIFREKVGATLNTLGVHDFPFPEIP